MTKHALKFLLGAGIMAIIALGVLYALPFFSPEYREEQIAIRELKDIQDQYMKDTYGGDTPEETLKLFINALKKGDTDLAAKYFVIDKQEEWRGKLRTIKEKNLLGAMVRDLEREKDKKLTGEDRAVFYIYNDEKMLALGITMIKEINGKWKIERI